MASDAIQGVEVDWGVECGVECGVWNLREGVGIVPLACVMYAGNSTMI
jgi:hypothetical protein